GQRFHRNRGHFHGHQQQSDGGGVLGHDHLGRWPDFHRNRHGQQRPFHHHRQSHLRRRGQPPRQREGEREPGQPNDGHGHGHHYRSGQPDGQRRHPERG